MAKSKNQKKEKLTLEQREALKKERFMNVAPPRVNKAIKAIGLVGNCAGVNYSYTQGQADAVVSGLQQAVDTVSELFARKQSKQTEFKMPA